ncbi:MAG: class I SAM-dependent rRNA methyltransferase [Methanococcaceae archaeon]
MSKVILRKNEDIRIRHGHLWVFSNEIQKVEDAANNGDLVELYDSQNNFLGEGFYNKNSLIAIRLLSRTKIGDLQEYFSMQLKKAAELRKSFCSGRNSYRLVFSESDFLPGLIIDKYNDSYVLQIYSVGMELNIGLINKVLKEEFSAQNIFTKNEEYFRMLEGLPVEDKLYLGERKEEIISDGAVDYKIIFGKTQKTGFYFDQSDNRFFIEKMCKNKTIIDAFCNLGGFGLHAAKAGAAAVEFIDGSAEIIQSVKENFQLNGFNIPAEFTVADVFDRLEYLKNSAKSFDVVMIDPPAFAKNKKSLPVAQKGYERLNRLALNIINDGGILVTSSCSFHLKQEDFLRIINTAAIKAGKTIQLIYFNNASVDHPRLPAMEETAYLKFAVYRVT